jgi:formamidopyrimidine-DNA glycosylase
MPELPEVETVRRGLIPAMEGRVIAAAELRRTDFRHPAPADLATRIAGQQIDEIGRRSKYLLFMLSSGEALILHLGMSGRILVEGAPTASYVHELRTPEKHDHLVLTMDGGAKVTFNDARRFGSLDLARRDGLSDHWLLAGIGPEPLGNEFHEEHLVRAFHGKATPVKSALLDQRLVAGLGNIYVAETLFRSRISPLRLAGDVSAAEVALLVPAIRAVLNEAIEAGGSSLRDHRTVDGELGYFQKAHAVYGREGEPCRTPGCSGTIQRAVQSGRSSFYCPVCQA